MFDPLAQQVQTLNKQLSQQNIQIKDLIEFLNKSLDKQKRVCNNNGNMNGHVNSNKKNVKKCKKSVSLSMLEKGKNGGVYDENSTNMLNWQYNNVNKIKNDGQKQNQYDLIKRDKLKRNRSTVYLSLNTKFKDNQLNLQQNQKNSSITRQIKQRQSSSSNILQQSHNNNSNIKNNFNKPLYSRNYEQKYYKNIDLYKHSNNTFSTIKLTNSLKYSKNLYYNNNKENKKYLQLSRPQKKFNISCSTCGVGVDKEININKSGKNDRNNEECCNNNYNHGKRQKSLSKSKSMNKLLMFLPVRSRSKQKLFNNHTINSSVNIRKSLSRQKSYGSKYFTSSISTINNNSLHINNQNNTSTTTNQPHNYYENNSHKNSHKKDSSQCLSKCQIRNFVVKKAMKNLHNIDGNNGGKMKEKSQINKIRIMMNK